MNKSERKELLFGEYVDRLLAGEWLDLEFIHQQHPDCGAELVDQLRSFQELADLPDADGPPHRLDDFEIIKEIGRGGMGVVFEATQVSLGRKVALKILPFVGMLDPRQIRRFRNEAQAAALLHHTNIVPIHAVGCAQGVHFYAMQCIEGRNLAELIRELRGDPPTNAVRSGENASQPTTEAALQESNASQPVRDQPADPMPPSALKDIRSLGLRRHESPSSKREFFRAVAKLGTEAAEAVAHAHGENIVHRDIKPSNFLIDERGKLWITDFGLAKMQDSPDITTTGDFVGTMRYMSPEQIAHPDQVDHRTDIYSLGITLFELLSLRPRFDGSSRESLLERVTNWEPKSLRSMDRKIPRELDTIIAKATEKDADRRYSAAQHLADDLRRFLDGRPIQARRASLLQRGTKWVRRHQTQSALGASVVIVLLLLANIVSRYRSEQVEQQNQALVGKIAQYIQTEEFIRAFELLQAAKSKSPSDPGWAQLDLKTAAALDIECDVPGVTVSIQKFDEEGDWTPLGSSPFETMQAPLGVHRWRAEKDGYVSREFLQEIAPGGAIVRLSMYLESEHPSGMVPVSPAPQRQAGKSGRVTLPEFMVDRYEVTNREYQEFVDQGGYGLPEFWSEPFEDDGSHLTFEEAMLRLRDQTGQPGPASWREGRLLPGTEDLPVSGVSWYEAAAYARFRNKSLPSYYHWQAVAGLTLAAVNLSLSNFTTTGPAPVGHHRAVTEHGLYDTAGNVREWCYNAPHDDNSKRFALGGSWRDPSYMFNKKASFSLWERSADFGIRCVRYPPDGDSVPEHCFAPIVTAFPVNYDGRSPASAEDVQRTTMLYRYDKQKPLNAISEGRVDSIFATTETISIDTTYDDDRMRFQMHFPKGFTPPYQVVVYNSGDNGKHHQRLEDVNDSLVLSYLADSGRILVFPALFGHFGRDRPSEEQGWLLNTQERRVKRAKDLMRVLDYLETRADVDINRVAYLGLSSGAQTGPLNLVVEDRWQIGVLIGGGLPRYECLPSCDPYDFAHQVKVPVLMVNGRNDYIYSYEESQRRLFEALGTAASDKRHVVYDGGHGLYAYARRQSQGEVVAWLDRYLGVPSQRSE